VTIAEGRRPSVALDLRGDFGIGVLDQAVLGHLLGCQSDADHLVECDPRLEVTVYVLPCWIEVARLDQDVR
jgi:hypothetical protein